MDLTDPVTTGNSYGEINIAGGNVHLGNQYINNYQDERKQEELAQMQFLQSVSYPEMRARLNEISVNEFDTFEWIFESDDPVNTDYEASTTLQYFGSRPSSLSETLDVISRNNTRQRYERLFLIGSVVAQAFLW